METLQRYIDGSEEIRLIKDDYGSLHVQHTANNGQDEIWKEVMPDMETALRIFAWRVTQWITCFAGDDGLELPYKKFLDHLEATNTILNG